MNRALVRKPLEDLGFRDRVGSVLASRTVMLKELSSVLDWVSPGAPRLASSGSDRQSRGTERPIVSLCGSAKLPPRPSACRGILHMTLEDLDSSRTGMESKI